MRKTESISKTIRIPKRVNEMAGECAASLGISINRFIVCSMIMSFKLIMSGAINNDFFVKLAKDYEEFDFTSRVRNLNGRIWNG